MPSHFLVPITDRLGGIGSGLQGILPGGEKNHLLIGATPDLQLSCLLCLLRQFQFVTPLGQFVEGSLESRIRLASPLIQLCFGSVTGGR